MHYLTNLWNALDFGSLGSILLRLCAVFLCLTIHETCHGLAAYALGDPTAKRAHRLSLNPLRHIDWLGLIMMVVAGFGWAKPVPVDPRYFKKPKQGMAITALAGPVSNFLLALVLLLIARGVYLRALVTGQLSETWFSFLLNTASLSVGLGLFNLVPIPPLDGSKVLAVLLPDRAYSWLMRYERFGMLLLLAVTGSPWPLMGIILLVLLPLASWSMNRYVRKYLRIDMTLPTTTSKNAAAECVLQVHNGARLPVLRYFCIVTVHNDLTGEREHITLTGGVRAHGSGTHRFLLQSRYCGRITASVDAITLMDYFGILPTRAEAAALARTTVLPELFRTSTASSYAAFSCSHAAARNCSCG